MVDDSQVDVVLLEYFKNTSGTMEVGKILFNPKESENRVKTLDLGESFFTFASINLNSKSNRTLGELAKDE